MKNKSKMVHVAVKCNELSVISLSPSLLDADMSKWDEVCVCSEEMTHAFIDDVDEFTPNTYLSFLTLPSMEKSCADNFRPIEFLIIYFFPLTKC